MPTNLPDLLSAAITEAINANLDDALREVGEAWASEARREAPAGLSGGLKGSIQYVSTSPGQGALRMTGYGDIVAEGIPGESVDTAAGRTVSMRPLSQKPRHVRKRLRYRERVGRSVDHPNPFYERAWQSASVQQKVADLPERLLQ